MPKIIVIRGPLGVGKSTVAKILAEKLSAKYLSLDQILEENGLDRDDGIPVKNFLQANKILKGLIGTSDQTYIIDGCFYYQKQMNDLVAKFPGQITIFSLKSDLPTCISRDAGRSRVYGPAATEFVYQATGRVKAGIEIDSARLTAAETADIILNILKK